MRGRIGKSAILGEDQGQHIPQQFRYKSVLPLSPFPADPPGPPTVEFAVAQSLGPSQPVSCQPFRHQLGQGEIGEMGRTPQDWGME
ncbi:MAG: hypothetical protein NPIRA06_28820 [Nitrospirales bacterium]|nr:MAG: hypothetical protein NPIRA06_28820 [Nitrospirales bacterium]